MESDKNYKSVILMGTYNGSKYLRDQLNTFLSQTIDNISVIISDDCSTDETISILNDYSKKWTKGKFTIIGGPGKGFAENYRNLLVNCDQDCDYVALSDQDDIWDNDKLEIAIAWLRQHPDKPALYGGRTRYVDTNGAFLRLSPLFEKPPSLCNALVQSIAGGNTMVMNKNAAQLLVKASRDVPFVSHDWWAYLIVTACGGIVHYDPTPHIGYRQHGSNVLGANDTLAARLFRIAELLRGRFAAWTDLNLKGLRANDDLITDEARQLVDLVEAMRAARLSSRLTLFLRAGLYRQTVLGTLGLVFAVIFGLF